jgi:hypothetical protein
MAGTNVTLPQAGDEVTATWGQSVAKGLNGIQSGTVVVTATAAARTEFTVTFPKAYASPPVVLCNAYNFQTSAATPRDTTTITATGFTGAVYPNAGGSNVAGPITVGWVAFGTLA